MMTPYDWQEGIGHRAQYVESRLAAGAPVLAIALRDGLLAVTCRRQARKLFEVYDRLLYAAVGQQSDVEAMRVAAIEFAHREGFQRSEQDVTVQRVVAALSHPVKKAFADFSVAPFVLRCLFAEVGEAPADDRFMLVDYDGDYIVQKGRALLVGSSEAADAMRADFEALDDGLSSEEVIEKARPILAKGLAPESPPAPEELELEAAILVRLATPPARSFRLLLGDGQ